jgi:hypothetical protein
MRKLNNGAVVIEQKGDVVLARWDRDGKYVTWKVDNEGNAYWGHYFTALSDAVADFNKRAAHV